MVDFNVKTAENKLILTQEQANETAVNKYILTQKQAN